MRRSKKIVKRRPAGALSKRTKEKLVLGNGSITKANEIIKSNGNGNGNGALPSSFFLPEEEVAEKDQTVDINDPSTLQQIKAESDYNKRRLDNLTKVSTGLYIGTKHEMPKYWQEKFLRHLQITGNIKEACEYAEISRESLQKYRRLETLEAKEFNELIALCKEDYLEQLEHEADRRGFKGYHEEVIYKGTRTGIYQKRYSDYLLALRLKAESPKYRDGGGVTINDNRKQVLVIGYKDSESETETKEVFQIED